VWPSGWVGVVHFSHMGLRAPTRDFDEVASFILLKCHGATTSVCQFFWYDMIFVDSEMHLD
jgi:hypothetical protein